MMRKSLIVAGLALSLLGSRAFAADMLLQTVDLTDEGMSAEGGEAKLFRVTGAKTGNCKIEVVHYGEMGRATYRFLFSAKLNYAARREYRYSAPITSAKQVKTTLVSETTLASAEGKKTLPEDYATYRAFFDPAKLAGCAGKK